MRFNPNVKLNYSELNIDILVILMLNTDYTLKDVIGFSAGKFINIIKFGYNKNKENTCNFNALL